MKKLGVKIAAVALLATSFLFLITQGLWAGNDNVAMFGNDRSIAALIFALLATIAAVAMNVVVFTKLSFGKYNRYILKGMAMVIFVMIILTFAIPLQNQKDHKGFAGVPKVFGANVAFFVLGVSTYIAGEVMINKAKLGSPFNR